MCTRHRSVLRTLTATGVLVLLLASGPAATTVPPPVFDLVDLGTLGGPESEANAINAAGQVVGSAMTADGKRHAARWVPGSNRPPLDLGTLGGSSSVALGTNYFCEVVGYSTIAGGQTHAFLRDRGGKTQDLGTLPGGTNSQAAAISDIDSIGVVVGSSTRADGSTLAFERVISHLSPAEQPRLFELGTLGGRNSVAAGINNTGQVVGTAETAQGRKHAFRRSGREMLDLGTLGGGTSFAYGVNTLGQVVGAAATPGERLHAFRWSRDGMQDLGTLGGISSAAAAINNAGQVVGSSVTASGRAHAFFYSDATGMVDVNTRIDYPLGQQWELLEARGINDVGWIVGSAVHNGQKRAFLLMPQGGEAPPDSPDGTDCNSLRDFGASVPLPLTRIAVFRPSTREWIVRNPDGSGITVPFGAAGDQPVPADYLGLGYDQIAVFRPSTRQWLIRRDDRTTVGPIPFGQAGDMPVPADYLGLGHVQIAVFRPGTQQWIIRKTDGTPAEPIPFGQPGDVPVPADYLGLGHDQIAVFRPGTSEWLIRQDDGHLVGPIPFKERGVVPVPGNYLGAPIPFSRAHAEIAVVRPASLEWFILDSGLTDLGSSSAQTVGPIQFGEAGDMPVPGAYGGTDRIQIAVFHPSTRVWRILKDIRTALAPIQFGDPGDQPVPAAYPYRLGR